MKYYRLSVLLFCMVLLIGCGKKEPTAQKEKVSPGDSDMVAIKALMYEYIDHMKEGDKTFLYENEFTYYQTDHSMSDYMEIPRVRDYVYDSLSHVQIDSVKLYGDSAIAFIQIFYESTSPKPEGHPYPTRFYRSQGKWIRPYLSRWEDEMVFLKRVEEYNKAVEAEEQGK